MGYSPANPPATYDAIWMRQELAKIREAMFSPVPFDYLETLHVAPPKPRDGMIALADGVDWNPGAGPGYYGYYGGRWVLLSGQRFTQCRFDGGVAANSVKLSRYGGSLLTVGGQTLEIPSNGIEVVPTGVTGGVIYYAYAYNNSGALAYEYNTTPHITYLDGTERKSGDPSRLLVGMFVTGVDGVIGDSVSRRSIASWFNPQKKELFGSSAAPTTSSTTPVVGLGFPAIPVFKGRAITRSLFGHGYNSNAGSVSYACIGNGSTPSVTTPSVVQPGAAGFNGAVSQALVSTATSDAIYNPSGLVWVSGGTGGWNLTLNVAAEL